ncbi:hypothetical protein K7H20_23845 [Salipiger manganoxidans]|uniref:hypothetical protein n=1 Tax=Salipiger marinus TaxID=555512 RepID=UPI001E36342C|nr:hypothetical protein [Salipiger manganoxidans]MCD1621073.1 hypothetical protein [Salipiger manganoxidans]
MLTDPILMTGAAMLALTLWAGICIERAARQQQAMLIDFSAADFAREVERLNSVGLCAHAWRLMTLRDPAPLYAAATQTTEGATC